MTYDEYIALGEDDRMRARLEQLAVLVAGQVPISPGAMKDALPPLDPSRAKLPGKVERRKRMEAEGGAQDGLQFGEPPAPFTGKPKDAP